MRDLLTVLDKEIKAFEDLKNMLKVQRESIIKRNLDGIYEAATKIEEIVLTIEKLEEERSKEFDNLKNSLGISKSASLKDLMERLENKEVSEKIYQMIKVINDVTIELRGITQILEFQEKYVNFLLGFFSSSDVYRENGKMDRANGSVFLDGRF